jgi:hypothetical protein
MMTSKLLIAVTLLSGFVAVGCHAQANPDPVKDWRPPAKGVIRDPRAAITIARAI